ncbi:hypothetical protein K491DRAFT_615105 [Lophiostoma macrostomum CBS 122681]|uniref:C2H2-type domain-containing protein n=1 Tax=Lophiostoma macrostomum CBS 122681 TaxID=1314788 RepID=A0A6A6SH85_9PLEO|nr:hypothetical protein K491DRAFT_615105 [Lophiostoma macrostomum CBS 122681]
MFDASTGFSSRTTSESASPNTSTRETTRSRDGLSDARQGKRKRGDDDDDEKEDNGRGKRTKKVEVPTSTPEKEKKRLACHYFKHDPRKYRDTRTCGGPGWETIHRVKEHLYRRHSVLPQCARCGENFPDAARLNEHLRNADACTICEVVPNEGIDKIKEEKLKNRRAVFQAGNEEEKWRDVYLILFPEADSSKIPSPYYHDDEPTNDDSPKAIEAERLQEYLSQTLPTIVRHELRRAIDAALAPIEENLTSRLETIVRDCQENATRTFLQNFQPYPSQSSMTYPPIAETYPFNAETQYPLGTQSSQETSVSRTPDALAAYAVPPESTFHSWPEPALGGQSFFAPATAPSDSAYHSDMSRAYQYLPNVSFRDETVRLVNMTDTENSGTMAEGNM